MTLTQLTSPRSVPQARRVAIIGSGIAGLAAAWHLCDDAQVTLFEAGEHFGGHAHTIDVTLPDAGGVPVTHGVDTGFLVFNERTYPKLVALLHTLNVDSAASDMSFSVQSPFGLDGRRRTLEWSGSNLDSVFAQRRNLMSLPFLGMLRDILRFNRLATRLALQGSESALHQPIGEFLDEHHFGHAFRDGYLLPMIGCIWSCPTGQMLRFPIATLIRFCHNHGLLQLSDRPQWRTVRGGSRTYVRAMLERLTDARLATPVRHVQRDARGAQVHTDAGSERFDAVVFACHSDQALALLGEGASSDERAVLGAIRYQPNRAVVHTDTNLLPRRRKAWAAWNYERAANAGQEQAGVCLHYWLNRLQPLPWPQAVIVSLNPAREPRDELVIGRFDYAHPVFDLAAIEAQRRVPRLQGHRYSWFCGAWCGHGFHEDGLTSALAVVAGLQRAWQSAGARQHGPGEQVGLQRAFA